MNLICLIFCIIISRTVPNYASSSNENQNVCKGDECLSTSPTKRTVIDEIHSSNVPQDFTFASLKSNLSDKEIYFMPDSDLPFDNNKIKPGITLQEETKSKDIEVSSENSDSVTLSTTEEVDEHTVTDLSKKDFSSSTVEPKTTNSLSTSTAKITGTTTQAPDTPKHSVFSQNVKKSRSICFCDLKMNECDINCCCDDDCTPSHFKVFTECLDKKVLYDSNYCYKSNFIFENNTYHKVVQSNGGLFCIVKENVEVNLKYETKELVTSLESFNKNLPNKLYVFSYKSRDAFHFINKTYVAGSPVWTLQNGQLVPFKIHYSSVGILCNAEVNIKYLVNQVKICYYRQHPTSQCESTKTREVFHELKDLKVITNPVLINSSYLLNSSMICRTNTCIGITSYLCLSIRNAPYCKKYTDEENLKGLKSNCWSFLSHIQYKIWHNGADGIVKMEAFLWVRRLTRISGELLRLTTEVHFAWVGSTKKVFKRSGNPGYLTGKPVLAGRKVYNVLNDTSVKKEAIELSLNPKDWLSILGSEKGLCSSTERIPVNFRENGKFMCSLKLNRFNFSKENCVELQNNIFKLLIGNEIINETKENYFNKFVATFGNSRVEDTGDWVQVLIDLFPISSSQASFKANHYDLVCKNIITDLYIYVIYSNFGSFLAPQKKILGVYFQFGKHRDLIFHCDTPGCENMALVRYIKLSTTVHFIDVTQPATDEFAEPLSLEVKLPHDFFYPFFSRSYKSRFLNKYVFTLFFLSLFY